MHGRRCQMLDARCQMPDPPIHQSPRCKVQGPGRKISLSGGLVGLEPCALDLASGWVEGEASARLAAEVCLWANIA